MSGPEGTADLPRWPSLPAPAVQAVVTHSCREDLGRLRLSCAAWLHLVNVHVGTLQLTSWPATTSGAAHLHRRFPLLHNLDCVAADALLLLQPEAGEGRSRSAGNKARRKARARRLQALSDTLSHLLHLHSLALSTTQVTFWYGSGSTGRSSVQLSLPAALSHLSHLHTLRIVVPRAARTTHSAVPSAASPPLPPLPALRSLSLEGVDCDWLPANVRALSGLTAFSAKGNSSLLSDGTLDEVVAALAPTCCQLRLGIHPHPTPCVLLRLAPLIALTALDLSISREDSFEPLSSLSTCLTRLTSLLLAGSGRQSREPATGFLSQHTQYLNMWGHAAAAAAAATTFWLTPPQPPPAPPADGSDSDSSSDAGCCGSGSGGGGGGGGGSRSKGVAAAAARWALRELDVSGCFWSLGQLEDCLTRADLAGPMLQVLRVSDNNMRTAPLMMGRLWELRVLDLSENSLTVVPACLADLTKLEDLDLSCNRLTAEHCSGWPVLSSLGRLQRLVVSTNHLVSLPRATRRASQLTHLDLSKCGMWLEHRDLARLTRLRALDITWNRLEGDSMPWLAGLSRLESLTAADTGVSCLPADLSHLSHLSHLVLSRAHTLMLPNSVGQLTALTRLCLHSSKIICLPHNVGALQRLSELDVTGCALCGPLPDSLWSLSALRTLRISAGQRALLGVRTPAAVGCLRTVNIIAVGGT